MNNFLAFIAVLLSGALVIITYKLFRFSEETNKAIDNYVEEIAKYSAIMREAEVEIKSLRSANNVLEARNRELNLLRLQDCKDKKEKDERTNTRQSKANNMATKETSGNRN